jgi:hypothetical protein
VSTLKGYINNLTLFFRKRSWSITLLFLVFGYSHLSSQTAVASEYQVKAVFLFNFSHFITWPNNAFEDEYSTFVIGIIGDDPFGPFIEAAVEGERIGSHVIRVKRFTSISEIQNCHILYIGTKDPDQVKKIINAVSGKNILTVGDTPNFARWGGMIRFYTEQNKIRLQINNTIARAEGLKISSKLLRVAQVF